MDASRRPELADPEFEPLPPSLSRRGDFDPRGHQRLVVNPFLAVLGLIALARAVRWLAESRFPPSAVLLVIPFLLLPHLIQFHCLDCGRSGRYPRRDRHACSSVVIRWNDDRSSRFPLASEQLVAWGWILGSIGLLILVRVL